MKILIAGDSLIKYMPNYIPRTIDDSIIDIKSYPGCGIEGLKEKLGKSKDYNAVVLHVGTNNSSRDPSANFLAFIRLLEDVAKNNPGALLVVSEILPRRASKFFDSESISNHIDEWNNNARCLNDMLQRYCESSMTTKFCRAQRLWGSWNAYLSRDGVHLTESGSARFSTFLLSILKEKILKIIKEKPRVAVEVKVVAQSHTKVPIPSVVSHSSPVAATSQKPIQPAIKALYSDVLQIGLPIPKSSNKDDKTVMRVQSPQSYSKKAAEVADSHSVEHVVKVETTRMSCRNKGNVSLSSNPKKNCGWIKVISRRNSKPLFPLNGMVSKLKAYDPEEMFGTAENVVPGRTDGSTGRTQRVSSKLFKSGTARATNRTGHRLYTPFENDWLEVQSTRNSYACLCEDVQKKTFEKRKGMPNKASFRNKELCGDQFKNVLLSKDSFIFNDCSKVI